MREVAAPHSARVTYTSGHPSGGESAIHAQCRPLASRRRTRSTVASSSGSGTTRTSSFSGRLVRREAVEQSRAARAAQRVLAAAAALTARGMRRVPRLRGVVVAQPLAVVVAEHGRALATARPVLARHVLAGRERGAVGLGAGEDVVRVGLIAAAIDGLPLLGER